MKSLIRPAQHTDADAMVRLLNEIIDKGGTTAHRRQFTKERMIAHYIEPPLGISCTVAINESDGDVVGFQALEWADPNWSGPDPLPADWAVVATFVSLRCQGLGIGRKLFDVTRAAAEAAGVRAMDASIHHENVGGQRFYERMGFVDYGERGETISKKFELV